MAWPSRLGNAEETGFSPHTAPADLESHCSWTDVPAGSAILIDDAQNVYCECNSVVAKVDGQGLPLWRRRVGTFGAKKLPVWDDLPREVEGIACGLALSDDRLYFASPQGYAVALNSQNGSAAWHTKMGAACSSDGGSAGAKNGTVVLVGRDDPATDFDAQNNVVYGLDAKTGKLLWKHRVQIALLSCVPVVLDDAVLFQSLPATVECLRPRDGTVVWQQKGEFSPGTSGGVGVSKSLGMVFVAANRKGKREWNMPYGGNGVVRAFKLNDGAPVWEQPFNFEANTVPSVAPVGPGGQHLVILGLGANPGPGWPLEARLGDSWSGKVVALDAKTGTLVWSYLLSVDQSAGPVGWDKFGMDFINLRGNATTSCACSGDGSVYLGTKSGACIVLDGATGKRKSFLLAPMAILVSPALGPGMVLFSIKTAQGFEATCWRTAGALSPSQVIRPLERSLEETGTEHFWPVKQGVDLRHPCKASCSAPREISQGPTWTFQFPNPQIQRWYDRPHHDFTHKTPVIDCQGNIYIETHHGPIWVVRPDGQLRGFIRLGASIANPALHGRYLYAAEGMGWAHCIDIETLKIKWSTKYARNGTPDSWNLTVADPPGVVLVMGENEPPEKLTALRMETGEKLWSYALTAPVYNFLPSVWTEKDFFIFCDSQGGAYCLRLSDGSEVWKALNESNKPSFSTGALVGAPNGLVYHAYNKGPSSKYPRRVGHPDGGLGVCRAWDRDTGEVVWTKEFQDLEANNAPMMVEKPDGGSIVVLPLGSNVRKEPDQEPFKWSGKIVGLDGRTGEEVWSWEPPTWTWPGAKGPAHHESLEYYNPDSWSNPPVLGADGTMYCQWHDGTIYSFDPFTGKVWSKWTLPDCAMSGIPAVGPGLLVCPGGFGLKAFRDLSLESAWRATAAAAGDGRAFEHSEPGESGDGLAPATEDCWGSTTLAYLPFKLEDAEKFIQAQHKQLDEELAKKQAEKEAKAKAKAEAKAKAKAKPEVSPVAAQKWEVVGGKTTGGIMAKQGKDLKSSELGRLASGSTLEQLGLEGDRLHYKKLSGEGPQEGWVSLTFKGNELVRKV